MPLSVRAALTPPICAAAQTENQTEGITSGFEENTTQDIVSSIGESPNSDFLHGALNEAALGGRVPITRRP